MKKHSCPPVKTHGHSNLSAEYIFVSRSLFYKEVDFCNFQYIIYFVLLYALFPRR